MPYDGRFPTEPVPKTLDWSLFCGPTELRAYNTKLWVKDAFKAGICSGVDGISIETTRDT
jgi:hypothetical protein